MPARLAIAAICTAFFAFAPTASAATNTCTQPDAMPSEMTLQHERDAIICLVNVERTKRGLRPLKSNKQLLRAASGHSREMVRKSYFDHQRPGGPSFVKRIKRSGYLRHAIGWQVGENLAWGAGSKSTPRQLVESWMESGDHRANLLDPDFRQIGLGAIRGAPVAGSFTAANGLSNALVVTADFGVRH